MNWNRLLHDNIPWRLSKQKFRFRIAIIHVETKEYKNYRRVDQNIYMFKPYATKPYIYLFTWGINKFTFKFLKYCGLDFCFLLKYLQKDNSSNVQKFGRKISCLNKQYLFLYLHAKYARYAFGKTANL